MAVRPLHWRGMKIRELVEEHYRHFNAATVRDAARAYGKHVDGGGKMFLTLAGAMSTAELGISLAEYVRRAIERELGGEPAPVDASGLFDLGDSGGSDVADRKDAYVGEAVSGGR